MLRRQILWRTYYWPCPGNFVKSGTGVSQKQDPVLPTLLRLTALLALYFLAGLILKKSGPPYDQVKLFWPPAGLALATVFILGYRFWPGVVVGTFLFSYAGGVPIGFFTATIAVGNTLAALGCVFLLQRLFSFESALERLRDVTVYLLVAGVLGTTINATANTAGLAWEHKFAWSAWYPNLLAWLVPNLLAVLVLAPVFTVWSAPSLWRWNFRQTVEALVCVTGLAVSTLFPSPPGLTTGFTVICWPTCRCRFCCGERSGAVRAARSPAP